MDPCSKPDRKLRYSDTKKAKQIDGRKQRDTWALCMHACVGCLGRGAGVGQEQCERPGQDLQRSCVSLRKQMTPARTSEALAVLTGNDTSLVFLV